jgi:hypothetical protein
VNPNLIKQYGPAKIVVKIIKLETSKSSHSKFYILECFLLFVIR